MSSQVSRRADQLNGPPPERERDASEDRMELVCPEADSRRLRNALILINIVAWLLIILAVRWIFF
jgi:hypothetical protein